MTRFIDLFAGIGGIRLGFEQAFGNDCQTVFVSEIDSKTQKTYMANFETPFVIGGDITKINEKNIPNFDICLAGFPCQSFSIAGKRNGVNDNYNGKNRGVLFLEIIRICSYHKPKVIFCENVPGLLTIDKGETFKNVIKSFENIGYKVFYKLLNSKNFGLPQNRKRVYIVAFRNDIAPDNFDFPQERECNSSISDIIEKNPVPSKYYLSESYLNWCKRHKERHSKRGNGFGYIVHDLNDIACSIVCGGMGKERNLIVDKRQTNFENTKSKVNDEFIRKLTPREWARLQGYPENFVFPSSDTQTYKELGNSVSVPVIKEIAILIKKVLDFN